MTNTWNNQLPGGELFILLLLYICDGGGSGDGSGVYMYVCLRGCHGIHVKGKEQHSGIDNSPSISGKHFNPLGHLPVSRELFQSCSLKIFSLWSLIPGALGLWQPDDRSIWQMTFILWCLWSQEAETSISTVHAHSPRPRVLSLGTSSQRRYHLWAPE